MRGSATTSSPTSSAPGCSSTCSTSRRSTGPIPLANHATIEHELAEHDPRLAALPRLLVLSKADLVTPEVAAAAAAEWTARLGGLDGEDGPGVPVLVTSSATGAGIPELALELVRRVPLEAPAEDAPAEDEVAAFRVFRPAQRRAFTVERTGRGAFRVTGEAVDRLVGRHDLENPEALAHVEHRLRRMGVIGALAGAGFEPGDDVEIAGVVFELDPGAPL